MVQTVSNKKLVTEVQVAEWQLKMMVAGTKPTRVTTKQCSSLRQFKWCLKTFLFRSWDYGAL